MVVNNRPSRDIDNIRFVHAWQPAGSRTILWAQDMTSNRPLHLVQWGEKLYLPVTEGLKLGICVYNGSGNWVAYPTYIEAKNLFDNGPSQPGDCTTDSMWETRPRTQLVMDALKNNDGQTGRPLIIVPNGMGMGIGEATYNSDEYRGQIRVYERFAIAHTVPRERPVSPLPDFGGAYRSGPVTRGGGTPQSFGYEEVTRGMGTPKIGTDHRVGIGAGAEERRESHRTGVRYDRSSNLVAELCVESRADLSEVLRAAHQPDVQWHWRPTSPEWFNTWTPSATPVSPHIPVAQPAPHRPQGTNWGGTY